MGKILVIFHSQQHGDTEEMAKAVADGLRDCGAEIEMINTNERRVMFDEFINADGIALGTPDYYSYVAGTIKTFFDDLWLWDRAGKKVKGKPAVFFLSHGSGGAAKRPFETFGNRFFEQVGRTIDSTRPTSDEIKAECRKIGKELAEKVK